MPYLSRLANAVLYSPFDNAAIPDITDAKKIFSVEKFIENCFVNPSFKINDSVIENSEEETDYFITIDEYRRQRYEEKNCYRNFENWLKLVGGDKIYTISGNAGTGKTTFINWVKEKCVTHKWILMDVSLATEGIIIAPSICVEIPHFSLPIMKVYSILIKQIFDILIPFMAKCTYKDVEDILEGIKQILANYHKLQPENVLFHLDILDELEIILNKNVDSLVTIDNVCNFLKSYFTNFLSLDDITTSFDLLSKALDILTYLTRFFYGLDEKFVLVFDNIERFIKNHEIFNPEVEDFRKKLNGYYSNINKKNHLNCEVFKIVLALRTSINRARETRLQTSDILPNNLDLSGWFDANKIIKKRKEYFIKLKANGEELNSINLEDLNWIETITSDFQVCLNGHLAGLKIFIDDFFNYDKRLIFDFLGAIIERNGELFKKYKELWSGKYPSQKFAARSLMRSLILIELKSQGFFENLKVCSGNNNVSGLGIARKILSILLNVKNKENRNSITLMELLKRLYRVSDLQGFFMQQGEQRKIDLIDIIIYLNTCNRRENNWLQFIDIQYKGDNTQTRLINTSGFYLNLINNDINGLADLDVSIMPAGEAFLRDVVCSFEYFSIRYNYNYEPLFSLVPNEDNLDSVEKLECIKIINKVYQQAKNCIENIYKHESEDFKVTIGKTNYFHYERIIKNHRDYLDRFAEYIELLNGNNKYDNLVSEIYRVRDKYNEILGGIDNGTSI